jgi:adenosylcobyric acid synthase
MAGLMIQGCGSDVGKSTLVAGLCRLFANRGLTVRPFKPQNMSNNAAVTADGGEIGRAQALQAVACRTKPCVDMNPVLLKPQSEAGAQLIVRGRMEGSWSARDFQARKASLLDVAVQSWRRLEAQADLVLVEGAGSPAETNLRQGDIANMGFAHAADLPVVLVGDINRGHVIAALVGAHTVLDSADRDRIEGFIINKFRGDPSLFNEGRADIVRRTRWPDLGLVPWLDVAAALPAEDGASISSTRAASPAGSGRVKIVAPLLSRIANFDDFDALAQEPAVDFSFIRPGSPLPGDANLVILPGTKATLADLAFLRAQGWDIDLLAHVRRGGRVMGVCGGYQMLGRRIADPGGIEGPASEASGLGLLEVETVLGGTKMLRAVRGRLSRGGVFSGYEMHVGETAGPGCAAPWAILEDGTPHGAASPDGRIVGGYVHGLFAQASARGALLAELGATSDGVDQSARVDQALDEIAEVLERSLDIAALERIAGLPPNASARKRPASQLRIIS